MVGRDVTSDCTRALDEERGSVAVRQRLEAVLLLARDTQRRTARDEHADARARAENRADRRRGVEEVLEVVEEKEQLPAAEEPGEVVGRSDRLRDLGVE